MYKTIQIKFKRLFSKEKLFSHRYLNSDVLKSIVSICLIVNSFILNIRIKKIHCVKIYSLFLAKTYSLNIVLFRLRFYFNSNLLKTIYLVKELKCKFKFLLKEMQINLIEYSKIHKMSFNNT